MENDSEKAGVDPTLGEFFEFVKQAVGRIEEKLVTHDARFDLVDARIDQRFGLANERMNTIDARLGDIQRQVNKTQVMVADVQDDLTTMSVALDKDSERVVDHELRIGKLEGVTA